MSSNLSATYGEGGVRDLFGAHFADRGDRRRAVEQARPIQESILDAIVAQNSKFSPSAARDSHLTALRHGAAAAVTGQQVGLFLGPLFTLYKAASAVKTAYALSAESGRPVVPVFWLQCEDHDLPEIASAHWRRTDGSIATVSLPSSPTDRVSLAHCRLPAQIQSCLEALRRDLGDLPHGADHISHLERHYREGRGWNEAFASLLADLFASTGLVIVNPRDPALARAVAAIHSRALVDAANLSGILERRNDELRARGFEPQVHLRTGAPLSFFHPAGFDGPRYRLEPRDDRFVEAGGGDAHTLAELRERLQREPLSFSSSVLLRPIVQDTLLPTAAYVGGPAEVAYFAQIAPLYSAFDVPMPLIVPRASLRLLDEKTADRLVALRHRPADLAASELDLLRKDTPDIALSAGEMSQRLMTAFDREMETMRATVSASGPGLETALVKTRATIAAAVAKLAAKYDSANLHRNQQRVDEIRRLQQLLFPTGVPQERYYGFAAFAARYGEQRVIEQILDAIAPFETKVVDLVLRP